MPKDNVIKRRSSHGKFTRPPPVATLRRRKSASAVLQPSSRNDNAYNNNNNDDDDDDESENNNHRPLVLKKECLNVSAGRKIYERASSRRQRHRLALKHDMELGEQDGTNHFVALGRGGARGPNRSSLTKEVPEGEDPGLQAIAASKQQLAKTRRRKDAPVSTKGNTVSSTTRAAGRSQRNKNIFTAKMMKPKRQQQNRKGSLREKLMKR